MWHSCKFYLYICTIRNKEVRQKLVEEILVVPSSFILWSHLHIGRVRAYLTMVFVSFVLDVR